MFGSRTAWILLLGISVSVPAAAWTLPPWHRPDAAHAAHAGSAFSSPGQAPSDSATLNGQGRGAQARFERTRALHAPLTWRTFTGPCDERLGRFCLTLGTDGPEPSEAEAWVPPPEDPRITAGREELLELLAGIAAIHPGDRWVFEQRVVYLGEADRWDEALELARACRLAPEEAWRCDALEGLSLHSLADFPGAEVSFEAAMGAMEAERAREWRDPSLIAAAELRGHLGTGGTQEAAELHARYWTMANPLFLVPGNDRWTEHLARHALAMVRSDARNAYQMRWGDDLAELLVRYGPEVAFEQERAPALQMGPTPLLGRMDRDGRGMLPEREHFEDPAAVPVGAWRTDRRPARERYAPGYARRIGSMQVQQARFRRGDDLFLVLGWAAGPFPDPQLGEEASPEVGLFIHQAADMAPVDARASHGPGPRSGPAPSGVATARIPAGPYVVSMEAFEPEEGRAWRARHGVASDLVPRGVPSVSDLVLLAPDASEVAPHASQFDPPASEVSVAPRTATPGTLEESLHRVLAGLQPDSRVVEVGWEVYSLEGAGPLVRYGISAEPVDRGLLRRAAELLRLASPPPVIDIGWEEAVDDLTARGRGDEALADRRFRSLILDLSTLPAGATRIELTMRLPGREPVTAQLIAHLPE